MKTNHEANNHTSHGSYSINDFIPLIVIVSAITLATAVKQMMFGVDLHEAMIDFMGFFFLVFGFFKVINLHGFAQAYSTYDIIAKKSNAYGYAYPFIELALGGMYLMRFQLTAAHWITLVLMAVSSVGVAQALREKRELVCACLGNVFKLPMTYVTLAEDVLMGAMAAYILFM